MSGRSLIAASCITAIAIAGCAPTPPVRLRWAENSTPLSETVVPTLSVSSTEAAPNAPARVRDFSERTAAAYISALSNKIPDADAFRGAIAAGIAPSRISDSDETRLPRTIVVGIGKRGYQAGQRLQTARVTIVPIGFAFGDFTLATSKYTTVDLENVSIQSTTTAKVGIAPEFGGTIEAAEASLTQEQKAGTAYVNRARIEALTPDFRPDRIDIYQQSAPNEDLTGAVLISASVRPIEAGDDARRQLLASLGLPDAKPFSFRTDQVVPQNVVAKLALADDAGKRLAPGEASVTTVVTETWRARPLYVCAAMEYVERVPQGTTARFFDEGRQVVTERAGRIEGEVFQLVPSEEVSRPLWAITAPSGGEVMIDVEGSPASFSVNDFTQAGRIAAWINATRADRIGAKALWVSGISPPRRLALKRGEEVAITKVYGAGPAPIAERQACRIPAR